MANITDVKVVADGYRNAVVRVSGILDTGNLTGTSLVTKALFTQNDPLYTSFDGFRIDEIEFSVSGDGSASVWWNATTPQLVGVFAGSNEQCWEEEGGLIPDTTAAGFDGSLNINTHNWVATIQSFTLTIKMIKLYTK